MNLYWKQYQSIETKLENLKYAIEFHPNNSGTYSTELASILMQSCSEFEIIAKRFLDLSDRATGFEIFSALCSRFPNLKEVIVHIENTTVWIQPFHYLRNLPKYWTAYNKVKHSRDIILGEAFTKIELDSKLDFSEDELKKISYTQANFENAFGSLGALLIINILLSDKEGEKVPASNFLFVIFNKRTFMSKKMINEYDLLLPKLSEKCVNPSPETA